MTNNQDPQKTDSSRIDKLEKLARNNRALIILAIVLTPLIAGAVLYDINAELREGSLSASIRSKPLAIPDSAKSLSLLLGIGGLMGLSKEQIGAIALQLFSRKED